MDIMIECHGLWRLPAAARIARALESNAIFWREDPIEMHRLDDLERLKQMTPIAIAGSENHGTAHCYAEAFARGLVDYAHFDIGWMGGLSEALEVAALARGIRRKARLLQELLDQVFDPPGVVALDLAIEIVEQRRQSAIRPVTVALASAGYALVRVDGDDHPRPIAITRHEASQSNDARKAPRGWADPAGGRPVETVPR